jgi:hypothetical protein
VRALLRDFGQAACALVSRHSFLRHRLCKGAGVEHAALFHAEHCHELASGDLCGCLSLVALSLIAYTVVVEDGIPQLSPNRVRL